MTLTPMKAPPLRGQIKLPTISPTRAHDLACPKRFGSVHIERTARPSEPWSPHLAYGSGLHAAMCNLYEPTDSRLVSERPVEKLVKEAFATIHYPAADLRQRDIERATDGIRRYRDQDKDAVNTVRVEDDYRFNWGHAEGTPITFTARFDRIVVRPDDPTTAYFIDYKTGKPGTVDIEAAAIALLVARACFGKVYPNQELWYEFVGPDGLTERVIVKTEDVRHLWPLLRDRAVNILHGHDRTATPGAICTFCPLHQECRPPKVSA